MTELELHCPTDDELLDAHESLLHILDLSDLGEIDLSPYLTRLLLRVDEILLATPATPLPTVE